MADFKTKLLMLAGAATMFAGMAFGQATLAATTPVTVTAGFIRAEGTTELLPTSTVNLTGSVAGSISLTVYLSPSLTVTSQSYGSPATSETLATANTGGTAAGVVSGSTITFSSIPTTAGTTSVTIANIRVNASALAVASGVPTGVSEQIFLGGANANPGVAAPYVVAYALNGLGPVTSPTTTNPVFPVVNTICTPVLSTTTQFTVNIAENFANSFKTLAQESGTNPNAPATNGTRLAVTFANIPTGVSVYVPLQVAASGTGTGLLQLIVSPTAKTSGTTNNVAAGTKAPLILNGQVTIANNTGTAYYELTGAAAPGLLEQYAINVMYASNAGALSAPATAAIATVSYAPVGSTTNVPNFVSGTSTTTVNGSSYSACVTTLLFPYVTNAAGFETGLAIANTSLDGLGAKAASSVASQSGTCALSFYGNATATSNPANSTTPVVSPGTTGTPFTLTSVAGAGFTGYMIANCNFQYAHGFAYIVYGFGTNSGVAMGYVANPLPQPRAVVGGIEALGN